MARKIYALALPICLLFSCTNIADDKIESATNRKPAKDTPSLMKTLNALTANKQCNTASDCKSIGVGHRACGGPEKYLIYSAKHTKQAELETKVEAYNAQRQKAVKKGGGFSTCMMLMPPVLQCVNNLCSASSGTKIPLQ